MIALARIEAVAWPSVEQQMEWLDGHAGSPMRFAYARLWVTCARATGATITARDGKIRAGWQVDDHHIERGQHLQILTEHMDAADQRERAILFLGNKS